MAFRSLAPLLFVGLVLTSCAQQGKEVAAGASRSDVGTTAPVEASLAEPPSIEGAIDPKQQRKLQALRGLHYDEGRAVIAPEEALLIVSGPDRAAADAAYAEGRAQLERNELLESITSHTKAVLLAPDVASMYVGLGEALVTQKGWEGKAAAAFRTGLDLDPESSELWYLYADALWRIGEVDGSVAAWERTNELQPDDPAGYQRLANVAFLHGEDARAWVMIHAAEARGGTAPPQMRQMLAARSPEPAR